MQRNFHLKTSQVKLTTIIFALLFLLSSCHQKAGDPEKFSEVSFDQLTEDNVPKGLVLSKGLIRLDPDYDLVHSSDSTKALIIRPGGSGGGTLAMRCDCDGLVNLGAS